MNAYDRIILKTTALILGAMCLGILVAAWASAEEPLCGKDFNAPLFVEVKDARICAQYGESPPCSVQCGRFVFRKNCERITWRGCAGLARLVDTAPAPSASPLPSRSPRPTAEPTTAMSGCERNDPAYCWAKGARLTVGGSCFANCTCILRGSGECAS